MSHDILTTSVEVVFVLSRQRKWKYEWFDPEPLEVTKEQYTFLEGYCVGQGAVPPTDSHFF